jgi:creatinine amidohydrolase
MTPPLCIADPATFWPWHRWPDFARWKNPAATVVVLPIAGFCDWALDAPLDAEETVLLGVLRAASESRRPEQSLLVTPPLRFVAGPDPRSAFAVDVPTAHAFIAEVAASVVAAGFRRIVLFNASPWNEELVVAATRDLRIALGAQFFTIQLSTLGLDFQPARAPDRARLLAALERGGDAAAAAQLGSLLAEIQAHPPLAQDGRIPPAQP